MIAYLNTVKDLGVEEVDTGINPVSNEFDGFLDESINDCRIGFGDYDTVVGGLGDFGYLRISLDSFQKGVRCTTHHDRSLTSVGHVKITIRQLDDGRVEKLTGTPRRGRYK